MTKQIKHEDYTPYTGDIIEREQIEEIAGEGKDKYLYTEYGVKQLLKQQALENADDIKVWQAMNYYNEGYYDCRLDEIDVEEKIRKEERNECYIFLFVILVGILLVSFFKY